MEKRMAYSKSPIKDSIMKLSFSVLFSLGFLLLGCNQKSKIEKDAAPLQAKESLTPARKFTVPDTFKAGLGRVYEGYEKIESALAHDDFPRAKEAFQSMHGILHTLPVDGLDSSGKSYWAALDASFMKVLHPMAASENISAMRDHLIDFSPLILNALENFGATSTTRAYLFHCPMARDNQGADWLQSDSTLLNPYFGKSMPNCGSFIREVRLL
jgi:membrane fusion protein, copper/silver efflux system